MVAAWKDGKRRDLDSFFFDAAARAAEVVAAALAGVDAVVPVPPHRRSVRRRGRDLTTMLAKAVATGLARGGVAASVERILDNRGAESRALAGRERWVNANRGIRVRESEPKPLAIVLVDDVVTTGASLARSSEALEGCGVAVVGALTLAATPLPRQPGPPSLR
jgi:predicted amidophosphoribosyltransferase